MRIFLLLLGLCSGCYHEPDDNNDLSASIPNRAPDIISDSGVFVYVETDDPLIFKPEKLHIWRNNVEAWWTQAQNCLGMYSDNPPVVLIVEDVDLWLSEHGINKENNIDGHARFAENMILVRDNKSHSGTLWRHEFIHIILHANGIDPALNSAHRPEYLWECENV